MCLGNNDHNFSHQGRLIDAVRNTSLQDIQRFSTALLDRDGFGEIILYSQGKKHPGAPSSGNSIGNTLDFKTNNPVIIHP